MSMLWQTKTRCNILPEIVQLQTEMVNPRGMHVKQLNAALKNAIANQEMHGLQFRLLGPSRRLVQVTDSGHITSTSCYLQEARIVLLAQDHPAFRHGKQEQYFGSDARIFGGVACPLIIRSRKAQRAS
eukprot:2131049-Pyramimonas_sp.AAC.1